MDNVSRLFGLPGKTALITGPTKGIGLATARLFAAAGARLVLAGHEREACDALAQELGARSIPTDVRHPRALERLAAMAGDIDILICNAGVAGPSGPMHELSAADRNELLAINLEHPLLLSGLIAPGMARRGMGRIILLSSIAGLRGNAGIGFYGMTKAALTQLARNLAVEWGPSGVRANAIAPGLIGTDWASAIVGNRAGMDRRLGLTPLRRLGRPEDIAAVALFLAGEASSFITGQTIVVDGGTLITDGS